MQGKGIIKFFLVLLTIVTLVQFLYMIPTNKVEKKAAAFAETKAATADEDSKYAARKAAETAYLDSMSSEVILSLPLLKDYTYEDLKGMQLALGLDLKGGMSVVLQVDLKELIIQLSNHSRDPLFHQALDSAEKELSNAQSDFVTLFGEEWAKISNGKKLAAIFSRNRGLVEEDNLTFEMADAEVLRILRTQANETVDLTFKRLKDRIDKFGVTQPNVSLDAGRDLITVELPGVDNPQRARNFLQATAKLEFWNVYRVSDPGVLQAFIDADAKLKREASGDTTTTAEPTVRIDTSYADRIDSMGNVVAGVVDTFYNEVPIQIDPLADRGPLLSLLSLNAGTAQGGTVYGLAVMGVAEKNKMHTVDNFLARDEIKNLFPRDMAFHWAAKPNVDPTTQRPSKLYQLYAIRKDRGKDTAPLEGDLVVSASSNPDPTTGEVQVTLVMNNTGAKIWADMTTKAAQDQNREIAIILDGEVYSAPGVRGPITGGRSSIDGGFTVQEGKDLANILEVGKLPAKTQIIQESLVGPSLGARNINKSMMSLLVGFCLVLIFMIFYYGTAGIVSIIALFANLFFIFGGLASFGTVLTMPGIAGIILTIGMAVDANVIIYERIREELLSGKSMRLSIADGFQHSYSAIIDANVTTILVAIVLAYFGMGPIKGFAVVLIIGVVSSLFTAVLLGRLMIEAWTSNENRTISFWTAPTKRAFSKVNIDWLGKRRIGYIVSSIVILIGITSFFTRGFELGVDFKGGYSYNIEFAESVNPDDLRAALTDAFEAQPIVKAVNTENTFNVTTSYLINDIEDDAPDRVMDKLYEGVNSIVGNIDGVQFRLPDGQGTHVSSSSKVGPTIADDIKRSSFEATIFALLLIFLYIFIRFNKWQYSMGAVAALFHDTLIVLAVFSIFQGILPFSLEIDQAFIAALLTVIGYSINDTVVVFDRIREFTGVYSGKTKEEVINLAVNSTVSRTIITSLTTLFVVAILFAFGGSSIRGFAFALVVGIIVGTYSSIFVATPIMADLTKDIKPKDTKKSSSFSKAATVK